MKNESSRLRNESEKKAMDHVMRMTAIDLDQVRPVEKRTEWENLDRQDWHLWLFAILLLFILGVSLLSFMFPAVFWFEGNTMLSTPKRAFFGYSILLSLVMVYMMQRQAAVRQLKRQLFIANTAMMQAKREAIIQTFLALPGKDQFLDTLAMDYRRAATSESHLAAGVFISPNASPEALGRMAYLLRSMLRRGESLYRLSDKALGVILPDMKLSDVAPLAQQVWELSGIPKDEQQVNITAYPDKAHTLTELEWHVRSALGK